MQKRAFLSLKRTFMHVSGPPSPYFDLKKKQFLNYLFFSLKSKYGWGRLETCINVRFRA